MSFSLTPHSIARFSARRPWLIVGVWLALVVGAIVLMGAFLSGALTTTSASSTHPESWTGQHLLEQRLRGPMKDTEAVIIQSPSLTVDDAAFKARVEDVFARINALGPSVVASSLNYYQPNLGPAAAALVSADKHTTLIPVTMAGSLDDASTNVDGILAIATDAGSDGFSVYVAGSSSVGHDFSTASEHDLQRGEMLGGVIALVILLLVFGTLVSAVVPLVLAVVAIMVALGVTALVGQSFQFSFFVTNMITMMGLAVGIDYTLFILSRFREERARGLSIDDAIEVSMSTAGRAVLFSGVTVIIALLGMMIVPTSIFRSLSAGATFVVFFAILASLTLLPALMRLLGDRVNSLRLPFVKKMTAQQDGRGGFWDRVATIVMRHPVIALVASVSLLVAFTIPFLGLHTGASGVSTLPDSFQSKQGFLVLQREFSGGSIYPAEIVLDGNVGTPSLSADVQQRVTKLQGILATDKDFGPLSTQVNQAGDLALLDVQMVPDPSSREATSAIQRLRHDYIPQAFDGSELGVYVSGNAAFNADFFDLTDHYTPYVFAFVLGLSFILLTLVFRSLVVPFKAIIMNLLSVGSAYGLLVLVFQKGVGANLLGFQKVESIEAWLPLFLFSVLFGLSMDYHVFLLSRIREHYDLTGNNTEAVAFGLRSTGRLITGAALIMVAVFGGFAMGQLNMLQQVGFGLGVSVLIDATVIRSVLVPASMKLLGRWNWYLPPVLGWLPHIGIEAHESAFQSPPRQPERA